MLRTSLRPLCRQHVLRRFNWRLEPRPAARSRPYTTGPASSILDTGAWGRRAVALAVVAGGGWAAYENFQPFRYTVLAAVRCSRVAGMRAARLLWTGLTETLAPVAAAKDAADYKWTFSRTYATDEERLDAHSRCHRRSAERVLHALLANGGTRTLLPSSHTRSGAHGGAGIFIKLGQHISSLMVLPVEWTSTMRPLQDRCEPTPFEDVAALVRADTGKGLDELFSEFDTEPIGVASLAQVHRAVDRATGKEVAVKVGCPRGSPYMCAERDGSCNIRTLQSSPRSTCA
jgi:aarF domain-containing kinase